LKFLGGPACFAAAAYYVLSDDFLVVNLGGFHHFLSLFIFEMGQSCEGIRLRGTAFLRIDQSPKWAAVLQQPQINLAEVPPGIRQKFRFFVRPGWLWNDNQTRWTAWDQKMPLPSPKNSSWRQRKSSAICDTERENCCFPSMTLRLIPPRSMRKMFLRNFDRYSLVDWGSEWISAKQKQGL